MITLADVAGRVRHRWRNHWLRRTFQNGEDFVRALGGAPEPTVAILRNGARIEHPSASGFLDVVLECWYRRVYLPRGFYRPMSGPQVIVDAGANVGLFSLQMLRTFPAARIEAFEPFPDNFNCLKNNLTAALFAGRWRAHPIALAAATGKGSMKRISDRSLDHVLDPEAAAATDDHPIETLSLAALFDFIQTDRIGYLKVDIEGSERAVFEAAQDADFLRIDHVAAEYHDHLVPGTLALLQKRLEKTHAITLQPSPLPGCGMLYARRRNTTAH